MLARVARSRAPSLALVARQGAPAAGLLARRTPFAFEPRHEREMSSKAALSKMGTLSVDPLAANSTVQGVEYVLTGMDSLVNWARKSSLWPMTFGLA
jgi:hypothetical protein